MAEHRIEMHQPKKAVFSGDIIFEVYSDNEKLGSLEISKGSVDWTPKGKQRSKAIEWERFAGLMNRLYDGERL